MTTRLYLLYACLFFTIATHSQEPPLKLWYNKPAGNTWEAALPVGNGRLAAMVYGNPAHELIKLNESSVWSGGPGRNDGADALKALPEVRKLIFEGRYKEASELAQQKIKTSPNNGMCYQPVGDLHLTFPDHDKHTDYYRDLDIENAVAKTSYTVNGVKFTREVFASAPAQVIIVRITSDRKAAINFTASITSPQHSTISAHNNQLTQSGISGDKDGIKGQVKFETLAKVINEGGDITATDSSLVVTKANAATIYISIATNFVNYHNLSTIASDKAAGYLAEAIKKSYPPLLAEHKKFFHQYFDRVKLNLGSTEAASKPTDERIRNFATANDPQLVALYFQFGRYLLISSSQPGGQPANLQGIWNDKIDPPWGSKYTININTEMNYWPAEPTHLTEMHEPLVQMVKELSVTGQQTAKTMYGASGWVAHHNTDLWRITGPVDGIYSAMWPVGGAWLTRHLWLKYLYHGNKKYLQSVYDAMKGAAEFYLDFLVEEPVHHWLVVSPSMSPENNPAVNPGVSIAAGTTVDNQIVAELFSNTIQAAEILGKDNELREKLLTARKRLPPMQIGQYGQLQEWMDDWDNPNDKHRHVSHLFGVYPSNQISPYRTTELFAAARTSLIQRGDISTGWSMGWKVNLWARFLDGNRAFSLIKNQLTPTGMNVGGENNGGGTYPNLFDAHPPFQIDGNFGCTAGIAEMLMQTNDGAIYLLPALPDAWQQGEVKGLCALGGFELTDMTWKDGKLMKATLKSNLGGNCRIRVAGRIRNPILKPAYGTNPNPFFKIANTPAPVISPKAKLQPATIAPTSLYDFHTEPGKTYVLMAY